MPTVNRREYSSIAFLVVSATNSEQAAVFESIPVFKELISSMTTHIDHSRIEHEVTEYYRYATSSHKWEDNELLFEK
jgi:hypothetical protein